jgi:hypothetical protein
MLPDEHGWRLVDDMTAFLTAGATKEEITRGEYNANTWTRCRAAIEAFEESWSAHRGGSFFGLAVWLAQRDETLVQTRIEAEKEATRAKEKSSAIRRKTKGKTQDGDRGSVDCVPAAIPVDGSVSTDALGHSAKQDPIGSTPQRDDGSMGVPSGTGSAIASPRQGSLFGDLGADDVRPRTRKRR